MGSVYCQKSWIKILFFVRILDQRILIFPKKESSRHQMHSIPLENKVPRAAPTTPSFGRPNHPKINKALKRIFNSNEVELINVLFFTSPIPFMTA